MDRPGQRGATAALVCLAAIAVCGPAPAGTAASLPSDARTQRARLAPFVGRADDSPRKTVSRVTARKVSLAAPNTLRARSDSMGLAVSLSWGAVKGATSYVVHRSTSSTFTPNAQTRLATVTTTGYRDDQATAGRSLTYVVVATAGSVSGPPSAPVRLTTSDEFRANRIAAQRWLRGQQVAAAQFRISFGEGYSGPVIGAVSGTVSDVAQFAGTAEAVPVVSFARDYDDAYEGPVSGTVAHAAEAGSFSGLEVKVYSRPRVVGEIEYPQGTFDVHPDGTWDSGALSVRAGLKIAYLVRRADGVRLATSGGGEDMVPGLVVRVFARTDADYELASATVASDGSWRVPFVVSADPSATLIARVYNSVTGRVLNSTEWAASPGYRGLVRSFAIPFDDPDFGYASPTGDRTGYRLEQRSWVYDDAVAVLALTADRDFAAAKSILSQLASLQEPDGSLRFSYDVFRGSMFDSYVRSGALAWVGSAALAYEEASGDTSYRGFAERVAGKLLSLQVTTRNGFPVTDRRYGSVLGGSGRYVAAPDGSYEKYLDEAVPWASTEHNIDAYFFLRDLGYLTGTPAYASAAELVKTSLLTHHWNGAEGRFDQGIDDPAEALDTGSWGGLFLLAVGERAKAQQLATWIERFAVTNATIEASSAMTSFNRTYTTDVSFSGYKPYAAGYSEPPSVVWAEGTWGAILFKLRLGLDVTPDLRSMQAMQAADPGGGFVQVSRGSKALPYEFHVWPAVGGTGWAALVASDPGLLWRPDGWRS